MRNISLYLYLLFLWNLGPLAAQVENKFTQQGKASYYASKFNGRLTANGETFYNKALTAAHPSLPFNTLVKVTNKSNGKSVVVRINDRGPHTQARILDLSQAAAGEIGMIQKGIATVQVEVIGFGGQIHRDNYMIAALSPPTLKNTDPSPDKLIAVPFSSGHTYSVWGAEYYPQGFGVQLAAYADLQKARDLCKQLLKANMHEVYIQVDWSKGEKAHRVVAGSFAEETQAQAHKYKLDKLGFGGFIKKYF